MPINRVRDAQDRPRFEFEFSRRIGGRRLRTRKLLPASWSRSQADAFDRQESARLYAQASGIEAKQHIIDDAIARYLDERAPELKTGREIAAELAALAPYWQGRPLDQLHAICASISRDYRAVVAPATLMNRLRYLISACRWGWKHHRMGDRDPGAGIPMPAVNNRSKDYYSRATMLRLARACEHRPTRARIRVAFYSGMRLGEIARVELAGSVFILDDTKNGEPRYVPVHPKVQCCAHLIGEASRFQTHYHFTKAKAKAGIERGTFHTLRHSTASALLGEGVELRTVGLILGHKSAASTARYAHLALDKAKAALDRIGQRPTSSPPASRSAGPKPASSPMEARVGVEPTCSDLQSRKRA